MSKSPPYKIEVSPAADRDIQKLNDRIRSEDFERLAAAIDELATEPRPHGVRTIEGAVIAYRIRAGNYRVVHDIYDDKKLVVLLQVVRRSETIYKS